jgi:hypothetical protein
MAQRAPLLGELLQNELLESLNLGGQSVLGTMASMVCLLMTSL